ncbi:imidazolonepropionase [Longirhabdus pacifica]|uniref:imidazolonepropionase n=1 Tax=Longirhabdus pacifica TaxID=2305227 RepID=UPI001008CC67|nr:imidazolonepropionase [Longirhabdus pacifica]
MSTKRACIIKNANQIITMAGNNTAPRKKEGMSELGLINNEDKKMVIAIYDGNILAVGDTTTVQQRFHALQITSDEIEVIDAQGKLVLPGFVDPHTHVVFAGSREYELNMRLNGASYLEILQQGGGILATTNMTREADETQLIAETTFRLNQFALHGVTTIEAKSGYGLTTKDECKMLHVIKKLNDLHALDIVPTFMAAHAIPPEYKENPDAYVDLIIDDMLPIIKEHQLAQFCDVFCEQGVFNVDQSKRMLEAAKTYGLTPKIHADEIVSIGGTFLASEVGAISAEHLLQTKSDGIQALAEGNVIATLLPGTAFYLMEPYAKAREMIDAGVAVTLSTDRNPGSSPTENIQLIMNLACFHMNMTPEEVLVATTINAAHAIHMQDKVGSLEEGKQADLIMMDIPTYHHLQYHYGVNHVDTVMKKGNIIVQGGVLL